MEHKLLCCETDIVGMVRIKKKICEKESLMKYKVKCTVAKQKKSILSCRYTNTRKLSKRSFSVQA